MTRFWHFVGDSIETQWYLSNKSKNVAPPHILNYFCFIGMSNDTYMATMSIHIFLCRITKKTQTQHIIHLLWTCIHNSHMQVDLLNLFKHFSFLTSMLLQMHAVSYPAAAVLKDSVPGRSNMWATICSSRDRLIAPQALQYWQATTRWATLTKSADRLTFFCLCQFRKKKAAFFCKVTLLYF